MMDWNKLISMKRLGAEDREDTSSHLRRPFQRDVDKIAFSSAFRRLQGKMQVHVQAAEDASDYARSRLTHSLECARIGRSLGSLVGGALEGLGVLPQDITATDLGDLVEAGALAHDIGSVAWGHAGEATIQDFYRTSPVGQELLKQIAGKYWPDLLRFEGNALGFRLLTRGPGGSPARGLKLTYTTLASVVKYPQTAELAQGYSCQRASERKSNFLVDDLPIFDKIATETGLLKKSEGRWVRHPLSFLVEAADDIAFLLVDIDDAYKLGVIDYDTAESMYRSVIRPGYTAKGDAPRDTLERPTSLEERDYNIETLRGRAISIMVEEAVEAFLENYDAIMKGTFEKELLETVCSAIGIEEIRNTSREMIYNNPQRMQVLIGGHDDIEGLLNAFGLAVLELNRAGGDLKKVSTRSRYILRAHPKLVLNEHDDPTNRVLRMTEYVAGMTDRYAASQARLLASSRPLPELTGSRPWNSEYHS